MRNRMLISLGAFFGAAVLAVPAVAASQKSAPVPNAWPAESLTGTVWTVDLGKHVLTVRDASGVPFDILVEPSTRIKSGERELTIGDLFSANRVSVEFVPEPRGDVAKSIVVKSGN